MRRKEGKSGDDGVWTSQVISAQAAKVGNGYQLVRPRESMGNPGLSIKESETVAEVEPHSVTLLQRTLVPPSKSAYRTGGLAN